MLVGARYGETKLMRNRIVWAELLLLGSISGNWQIADTPCNIVKSLLWVNGTEGGVTTSFQLTYKNSHWSQWNSSQNFLLKRCLTSILIDAWVHFCPCGKIASTWCPKCSLRGYCSASCMAKDERQHNIMCQPNVDLVRKSLATVPREPQEYWTPKTVRYYSWSVERTYVWTLRHVTCFT